MFQSKINLVILLLLPVHLNTAAEIYLNQDSENNPLHQPSDLSNNISTTSLINNLTQQNELSQKDNEETLSPSSMEDSLWVEGHNTSGTILDSHNSSWVMVPEYGLNSSMMVTALNTTEHKGFLHGFVESLSVILVSELGDKTFFIAAILAMSNNKLIVFLAAISALAAMTVLSALLGFVVTKFIPRVYTYYACTGIMFLFGLKMLYEAWKMSDNELEETQREVEEEIARRGSISSSSSSKPGETREDINTDAEANVPMQCVQEETKEVMVADSKAKSESKVGNHNQRNGAKIFTIPAKMRENSWFGKKCCKIFRVFTNTFGMTFLAEWGDRSQLATIVLAGINDVSGVCVGGILGHFICTGLAVLCGALIAKKISVRKVTLLGALVFIGFAIASLFIDPYEENHKVPDVEGDDHSAPVYQENDITFIESTTNAISNILLD